MRLTTDTPKNNIEMALNLFYVKDKEVWVRGYGKNGADISLFDLSRDLTRWNCPYVDLDISDDSFSMMMAEWLWEDVESFEHVLALLYQAAWVCAELREHLKQFEDTGWTPEMLHKLGENAGHLWDFAQAAENMTVGRLKELAEADKDGRVLILPCKLGTKVYRIRYKIVDYPDKPEPEITTTWFTPEYREDIGKIVFFTREEAEKALQEMGGKKDG